MELWACLCPPWRGVARGGSRCLCRARLGHRAGPGCGGPVGQRRAPPGVGILWRVNKATTRGPEGARVGWAGRVCDLLHFGEASRSSEKGPRDAMAISNFSPLLPTFRTAGL